MQRLKEHFILLFLLSKWLDYSGWFQGRVASCSSATVYSGLTLCTDGCNDDSSWAIYLSVDNIWYDESSLSWSLDLLFLENEGVSSDVYGWIPDILIETTTYKPILKKRFYYIHGQGYPRRLGILIFISLPCGALRSLFCKWHFDYDSTTCILARQHSDSRLLDSYGDSSIHSWQHIQPLRVLIWCLPSLHIRRGSLRMGIADLCAYTKTRVISSEREGPRPDHSIRRPQRQ